MGDYLGLSGWEHCNHKGPQKTKMGEFRERRCQHESRGQIETLEDASLLTLKIKSGDNECRWLLEAETGKQLFLSSEPSQGLDFSPVRITSDLRPSRTYGEEICAVSHWEFNYNCIGS